jgi:two-component system, chemotaxis family, chemotaxis protein CheY
VSTEIRTLIVDDEVDMRTLARLEIERRNHGLMVSGEAGDGPAALAGLEAADPTVVVIDYRMPGMDGIETSQRIRARRPDQLIVLFSAFLDARIREDAAAAGVTACLDKRQLKKLPDLLFALSS